MNYFGLFFSFGIPGIMIGAMLTASIIGARRKALQKRSAEREAAAKSQQAENAEKMRKLWEMRVG